MKITKVYLSLLVLVLTPACVIAEPDDDDSSAETDGESASESASASASESASGASASASGSASESASGGSNSGGGSAIEEGAWEYSESEATVDCGAAPAPTNGFGDFGVSGSSSDGFTVNPNDGTDSFDCDLDGSGFLCPDRLVDSASQDGFDAQLEAYVEVVGTVLSSTSVEGEQQGRLECTGSDCGAAAAFFGATFPCTFSIDFDANKT